ncbi:alpha-tubulin N-acetyltransferase [Phlebotomus argentipes]|uniref:alpha-tubulin N-acetyltransferase n=1 Tax=Phlebotomus argentipes TaxID=94469 RepID=UPI0028934B84|nr:alpha-tubulin N-acetyltransferase [Phlebotomus argentipes]XP_059614382.1 alpha-tubulin N-acetyltransferase [Phlebotomus argentipes]XP_059614383.1 alpha-tubulin N-acetyltransferase [Phlebotomus argentipes]
MEFRFNVTQYFKTPIIKVTNTLLPNGYYEDRRAVLDATSKVSEILNDIGEASAQAQGLTRAVTTAQKLRNSDHIVYLMSEKNDKTGVVTGLLKVGVKSLYVFDSDGETHKVNAPCVLDFYIHESRQRAGLGKVLFQYMLDQENYHPQQLAIDRPSDKLVGFLRKHYGLTQTIPQMNNFVVYEGFFDHNTSQSNSSMETTGLHFTNSPNTMLFGPQFKSTTAELRNQQPNGKSPMPTMPNIGNLQNTPVGRYAAQRPRCSMAEIIHNSPGRVPSEPQSNLGYALEQPYKEVHVDEEQIAPHVVEVAQELAELELQEPANGDDEAPQQPEEGSDEPPPEDFAAEEEEVKSPEEEVTERPMFQRPTHFHHNKQHTGLKNLSFNVGMAVTPTAKMEFDQEAPESFGVVKIGRPIGGLRGSPGTDAGDAASVISGGSVGSHGSDPGFLDLKFYHNKLW